MRCQEFKRLQGELYDGSASREIEDELIDHMAQCKGCSGDYVTFSRAMVALRQEPVDDPPVNLWELFQEYAVARRSKESISALANIAERIRGWRSNVCEGIILFTTVATANLCRKLERYVTEA